MVEQRCSTSPDSELRPFLKKLAFLRHFKKGFAQIS